MATGQAVHALSGAAQSLDGTAVTLSVPSPVSEQPLLTVTLSEPPGAPVMLIASPRSGMLTIGAVSGPLLTGVQALSWTLQVITVEGGQRIAGPATSLLLLLDAALSSEPLLIRASSRTPRRESRGGCRVSGPDSVCGHWTPLHRRTPVTPLF